MTNLIIAFRSFANTPDKKIANTLRVLSSEELFFTKPVGLYSVRKLSNIREFHSAYP